MGQVISGAFLAVDRPAAPALYARLKRIPGISTVAVREAVVRGFERTIAESFLISAAGLLIFGSS